jgi:2-methylcitrate dehydratase PrpD
MDEVEKLGEALVSLALWGRIASRDEERYRAALLNYLGVALAGSHEPSVEAFEKSRAALTPGNHTPLGRNENLSLADCVMADCYASSVHAYDDIHFPTTTHPAGPVASAILGVARLQEVQVGEAVRAMAVGMEVECRLGLVLFSPRTGSASGWYTTGIVGGVGAAAAAGRLLGLDRAHMASALGWAAAGACGVRGTHGSAAGTFVPALAARAGLEAALLSRDGLACGITALTGANGLMRSIAQTPDCDRALYDIGKTWVSAEASCKPYPFGFVSFAAVDAALELAKNTSAMPTVTTLKVAVSPRAARLGGNPRPASADEAIVSIPYLVARTLADPSSVQRPIPARFAISARERDMLGAIRLEIDPTLADSAARISLNGSELEVVCDAARGSADKPLTIAETKDKFCSICGLDEPRRLMQAIEEGTDDLAALIGVR